MPLDDIEREIQRLRDQIAGQCNTPMSAATGRQIALALLDIVEDIVQSISESAEANSDDDSRRRE